jgi:hypothetical protein
VPYLERVPERLVDRRLEQRPSLHPLVVVLRDLGRLDRCPGQLVAVTSQRP